MLNNIADELKTIVLKSSEQLLRISDLDSKVKPSPGKWSKIEILGHLVDSASNNHQRFVRVQYVADYWGPEYLQDDWVRIQAYNNRDWCEIVELWKYYNLHLADIIKRIPDDKLKVMFRIGSKDPVSLEFVANDYLRHLKHHLGQIGILSE